MAQVDYQNLFSSPCTSLEERRAHSARLDEFFGYRMESIEGELLRRAREASPEGGLAGWGARIHDGNQTWVGLCGQTLNTPYSELQDFCRLIKPRSGMRVLDLGAGYGRLGLVLHFLYPGVKYLGLEYVPERVTEGNRVLQLHGCDQRVRLERVDLRDPALQLPPGDAYFLYDFGTLTDIRRILKYLEAQADARSFQVVARGHGTRSIIQYAHPWLTRMHDPIHEETFSIYRS